MRIGFDSTEHLQDLLGSIERHSIDLLSLHGRTVKEMYQSGVHYDVIANAVRQVRCPVLANGEVSSAGKARAVLAQTGARGVMIGRHAIRNPWVFRQCRELEQQRPVFAPTLADVREYVERLYFALRVPDTDPRAHVTKMKKYLNFVGLSVDPDGAFLHAMRRAASERELFAVCDRFLLTEPQRPFAAEPFAGLLARPRCEGPACS